MKFEHRELRKMLVDIYNEMKVARDELEKEAIKKKADEEAATAVAAAKAKKLAETEDEENVAPKYTLRERRSRHESTSALVKKDKKNEVDEEDVEPEDIQTGFRTITRYMHQTMGIPEPYSSLLYVSQKLFYPLDELILVNFLLTLYVT